MKIVENLKKLSAFVCYIAFLYALTYVVELAIYNIYELTSRLILKKLKKEESSIIKENE